MAKIRTKYIDDGNDLITCAHSSYESAFMTLNAARAFGAKAFVVYVDGAEISGAEFVKRLNAEIEAKNVAFSPLK